MPCESLLGIIYYKSVKFEYNGISWYTKKYFEMRRSVIFVKNDTIFLDEVIKYLIISTISIKTGT